MEITIEYKTPSVKEYQELRGTTSWDKVEDFTVSTALSRSQFAVCILDKNKVVATGRIIGDGIYYYIQDVMVLPNYQKKGFGRKVMEELEEWLKNKVKDHAFIGLMAAKGTIEFYKQFGYEIRGNDQPGMYKLKM